MGFIQRERKWMIDILQEDWKRVEKKAAWPNWRSSKPHSFTDSSNSLFGKQPPFFWNKSARAKQN
jgi:hypothetical protein